MSRARHKASRGRIRNRLILFYSIPLLLLLTALSFFYDLTARRGLEQEMALRLETLARQLALQIDGWQVKTLLTGTEENPTYGAIKQLLARSARLHEVSRIYLFDFGNRSLADSDGKTGYGQIYFKHEMDRLEINRSLTEKSASSNLFRGSDGRLYKTAYAPIMEDGRPLALIGVEASAAFFEGLRRIRSRVLIFFLGGIGLVILISVLIARRIVLPLQRLVLAAKAIGEGDLEHTVTAESEGEIGFLAQTMDEMRGKIVARDLKANMMLRGIAHELRNPLGAIELHSGLIGEEAHENREIKEYAKKIHYDVLNLKRLIEEFLDFGREPHIEKQQLNTEDFLQQSLLPLMQEGKKNGIDIAVSVEAGAEKLHADPDNLRRALLNLYINALQAMPGGGKLNVRAGLNAEQNSMLDVSDSGEGVASEHAGKLFDPFYTSKEQGSGLGLAFAQKIVEAHGGDIRHLAGHRPGATFRITLPASGQA